MMHQKKSKVKANKIILEGLFNGVSAAIISIFFLILSVSFSLVSVICAPAMLLSVLVSYTVESYSS